MSAPTTPSATETPPTTAYQWDVLGDGTVLVGAEGAQHDVLMGLVAHSATARATALTAAAAIPTAAVTTTTSSADDRSKVSTTAEADTAAVIGNNTAIVAPHGSLVCIEYTTTYSAKPYFSSAATTRATTRATRATTSPARQQSERVSFVLGANEVIPGLDILASHLPRICVGGGKSSSGGESAKCGPLAVDNIVTGPVHCRLAPLRVFAREYSGAAAAAAAAELTPTATPFSLSIISLDWQDPPSTITQHMPWRAPMDIRVQEAMREKTRGVDCVKLGQLKQALSHFCKTISLLRREPPLVIIPSPQTLEEQQQSWQYQQKQRQIQRSETQQQQQPRARHVTIEEYGEKWESSSSVVVAPFHQQGLHTRAHIERQQQAEYDAVALATAAHNNCAHCLLGLRQHQNALFEANTALFYQADNTKACYRCAMALCELGRHDEAENLLITAMARLAEARKQQERLEKKEEEEEDKVEKEEEGNGRNEEKSAATVAAVDATVTAKTRSASTATVTAALAKALKIVKRRRQESEREFASACRKMFASGRK